MGMAARNGVAAALLARAGFGGPRQVFDHGHTVFKAFQPRPRGPSCLTRDLGLALGRHRRTRDQALPLRLLPAPGPHLPCFALVDEHALEPEQIEEIVLRFPRAGVHCIDANPLKSHCAQYVLPVALARGRLEVRDLFDDRRATDPLVSALAARVRVEPDDGALAARFPHAYASELILRTQSGTTHRRRNDIARGYPATPLGRAELAAKAAALVGPERAAALARSVEALPAAPDVERYALALEAPLAGGQGA